ncbi:hypothetical protein [Natronorubrum tibetense]|uniref:hypothetical protein n=1 Tax=Natronorubrum tibetense TaxID=63128 RepID=UPI00037B5BB3|nr:hypothetical protein [Natronorubrum tibetense]
MARAVGRIAVVLAAFRSALERALDERSGPASQCLERSVDRLRDAYASVSGW